jgi:ABC-type multidrug transport system ATPase subunit
MLEIKNLTKIYKGSRRAVDNLSLKVEKGDIFAFIGHNGAGKSTTIKACVGIIDFNNGDIYNAAKMYFMSCNESKIKLFSEKCAKIIRIMLEEKNIN